MLNHRTCTCMCKLFLSSTVSLLVSLLLSMLLSVVFLPLKCLFMYSVRLIANQNQLFSILSSLDSLFVSSSLIMHYVKLTLLFIFLFNSSEEWKKLKQSDREKLGIVFENDGEFW